MNMKKYVTVAGLIGAIWFAGISRADARGYYGAGYGRRGGWL